MEPHVPYIDLSLTGARITKQAKQLAHLKEHETF